MHDDFLAGVCLTRSLDPNGVTLHFHDWPGSGRAIVHFALSSDLGRPLAEAFAPRHRVLSLQPRDGVSYQTDAADLRALLQTFGFPTPLLVGKGLGAIAPLLVAAWWPDAVAALLLIAPVREAESGLAGRGLRECPPDWDALLALVRCPAHVVAEFSATDVQALLLETGG